MLLRKSATMVGVLVCIGMGTTASADVDMEWVHVGDVGNTAEPTGVGYIEVMCGGVDYEYAIGKYEVTNGQYVEFLNAVASSGDPNGVYNSQMGTIRLRDCPNRIGYGR